MNTIKLALLGTAAIAAVSVSAQASTASDVAALRAQVEALSAQVAAAQTTADLPAGYQFLSTSMQPSLLDPTRQAYTISIMPTADAPASTVMQWSGFVRAAFQYTSTAHDSNITAAVVAPGAFGVASYSTNSSHILGRAEFSVTGKTDTAVGEVGANIVFRNEFDASNNTLATVPTAKGWWAISPNLTLQGGTFGIVGGIGGYGADKLNAMYTGGAPNSSGTPGDTSQFDLVYADGPISFAVGVDHYAVGDNVLTLPAGSAVVTATAVSDFAFGAAAEYKGDSLSAKVAGWVHGADYQVGVGATATMDMFTLSAAGAIGKDAGHDFARKVNVPATAIWHNVEDATYWNASMFAGASLTDSVKAEIGVGYNQYTGTVANSNKLGVAGGLYYTPVKQLTIGAEASWNRMTTTAVAPSSNVGFDTQTDISADIVSVFAF